HEACARFHPRHQPAQRHSTGALFSFESRFLLCYNLRLSCREVEPKKFGSAKCPCSFLSRRSIPRTHFQLQSLISRGILLFKPMDTWQQILKFVEARISKQDFANWFKPTQFKKLNGRDTLVVAAPNDLFVNWLAGYSDLIGEAI